MNPRSIISPTSRLLARASSFVAAALFVVLLASPAGADDGETVFSTVEWDIRSLPAIGFFPLGGNLRGVTNAQISTYILGTSVDLFNYNEWDTRLSLLNVSGYLIGLNYAALQPESEAQVFNLAYVRAGPHYRFSGLWDDNLSLGSQLGYGFLLRGDTIEGTTAYQHGIDISFTFSWTEYRRPPPKLYESSNDNVKAVVALLTGAATLAATSYGVYHLYSKGADPDDGFLTTYLLGIGGYSIGFPMLIWAISLL